MRSRLHIHHDQFLCNLCSFVCLSICCLLFCLSDFFCSARPGAGKPEDPCKSDCYCPVVNALHIPPLAMNGRSPKVLLFVIPATCISGIWASGLLALGWEMLYQLQCQAVWHDRLTCQSCCATIAVRKNDIAMCPMTSKLARDT